MPFTHQLLIDLLNLLVEVSCARVQFHAEMLVLVGLQVVQMLADRTITTFTLVVFGQVVDILATVRLVVLIQLVREQVIVQIVIVIIIQVHACIHFIVIIFHRHLLELVVLRFSRILNFLVDIEEVDDIVVLLIERVLA